MNVMCKVFVHHRPLRSTLLYSVKVKYSHYRPSGFWGFWQVKTPEFLDTWHMKVVRSSPLRTGRLYPQEYPGTHFQRLSRPQGTWNSLMPRKKSPVTGDRSRDPPYSSAGPSYSVREVNLDEYNRLFESRRLGATDVRLLQTCLKRHLHHFCPDLSSGPFLYLHAKPLYVYLSCYISNPLQPPVI